MLNVDGGTLTLTQATIDLSGFDPSLIVNGKVYLLQEIGFGAISGLSPGDPVTSGTHAFIVELDNGGVFLVLQTPPPPLPPGPGTNPGTGTFTVTIIPVSMKDNTKSNGDNTGDNMNEYNTVRSTVSNTVSNACSNPVITSISADPNPVQRGATLSVVAWGGTGCVLSYQWQVYQSGWVDIPGATTAIFDYINLRPGPYSVRCIVTNAAGEMISTPVTFRVSE
jgi:hypothetical protein